jgi:hypothetical protein
LAVVLAVGVTTYHTLLSTTHSGHATQRNVYLYIALRCGSAFFTIAPVRLWRSASKNEALLKFEWVSSGSFNNRQN